MEVTYSEADVMLCINVKWHTAVETLLVDAQAQKAEKPLILADFESHEEVKKGLLE